MLVCMCIDVLIFRNPWTLARWKPARCKLVCLLFSSIRFPAFRSEKKSMEVQVILTRYRDMQALHTRFC